MAIWKTTHDLRTSDTMRAENIKINSETKTKHSKEFAEQSNEEICSRQSSKQCRTEKGR